MAGTHPLLLSPVWVKAWLSLAQGTANQPLAGWSGGGPFKCYGWVTMRGCPARRPLQQRGNRSHNRQELKGSQGRRQWDGAGANRGSRWRQIAQKGSIDTNFPKFIEKVFCFLTKERPKVCGHFFFSPSQHGCEVHMDLVDLYLPECFTFHSDTE